MVVSRAPMIGELFKHSRSNVRPIDTMSESWSHGGVCFLTLFVLLAAFALTTVICVEQAKTRSLGKVFLSRTKSEEQGWI